MCTNKIISTVAFSFGITLQTCSEKWTKDLDRFFPEECGIRPGLRERYGFTHQTANNRLYFHRMTAKIQLTKAKNADLIPKHLDIHVGTENQSILEIALNAASP